MNKRHQNEYCSPRCLGPADKNNYCSRDHKHLSKCPHFQESFSVMRGFNAIVCGPAYFSKLCAHPLLACCPFILDVKAFSKVFVSGAGCKNSTAQPADDVLHALHRLRASRKPCMFCIQQGCLNFSTFPAHSSRLVYDSWPMAVRVHVHSLFCVHRKHNAHAHTFLHPCSKLCTLKIS